MIKKAAVILLFVVLAIAVLYWYAYSTKEYRAELASCKQEIEVDRLYSLAIYLNDESNCPNELCRLEIRRYAVPCEDDYCRAVVEKRPDLCAKNDFWCQARAKNTKQACESIADLNLQAECFSLVDYDESYFSQKKRLCIDLSKSKIALRHSDERICESISDEFVKENCIKNVRLTEI